LGQYDEAIVDFHQTLELNAYHFPAAAAMGQAYLELNDQADALESFRRALKLNPDLEGVRARVLQLQRQVDE
jgi:tetratricopeptide (TPR) repeat protein